MNYFLLKLAFDTAVHFGGSDSAVGSQSSALTLRADTIFSALCHTALEVYGEPALEELLVSADADALRISDAMPWRGNSFYLPKPIAASTSPAELSTVERKAVKKLAWIPASKFDRYTASLHSGTYPLDELDQSILNRYAHPITKDALLEAIAEFSRFYQDAFLSHFPQGHPTPHPWRRHRLPLQNGRLPLPEGRLCRRPVQIPLRRLKKTSTRMCYDFSLGRLSYWLGPAG